eukprot:TRINITY_DN6979_c0_g1_i1.p1 TRINITY_DN6979_c0_g1~~TRINITY_DN6979_c0_g1_i1.p1  ORF type:complete len:652 (+),score=123.43 TRINITY_DN6979_c0_g1_i1:78-2033(+)
MLSLSEYRDLLKLGIQYQVPSPVLSASSKEVSQALDTALLYFFREHTPRQPDVEGESKVKRFSKASKYKYLKNLLTIREPSADRQIPERVQQAVDTILHHSLLRKGITSAENTPRLSSLFSAEKRASPQFPSAFNALSIWKGDITTLKASAIVNAANSAMLGCFRPDHPCIDNAIHAQAGPQLREDCLSLMKLQQNEEETGVAKVTRAYNLPSQYVLHTVGPIIANRQPTTEQQEDLARCYTSCLDLAAQIPQIESLAFCCISTGQFAFPARLATTIAFRTVMKWLDSHSTQSSRGGLKHIIFNVFSSEDEAHYIAEMENIAEAPRSSDLSHPPPQLTLSISEGQSVSKVVDWLKNSSALLISAGAGLSAAAGLDYTDEALFQRLFPAMVEHGFTKMYDFIGPTGLPDEVLWAYRFDQIHLARYKWGQSSVYQNLKRLFDTFSNTSNAADEAKEKAFVYTSNVDGMFQQNGFPVSQVYTTQGDYSNLQCLRPCSREVYPTLTYIEAALPHIDRSVARITKEEVIPRCPRCGGDMMMNVRGGDWFIEDHLLPQRSKMNQWLMSSVAAAQGEGKLVTILEIGAGFNTPSVIRWPMESLLKEYDCVRLVRINSLHPEVTIADPQRSLGLDWDATFIIQQITDQFFLSIAVICCN